MHKPPLVLGILYESFVHPFTILSGLPFAGFWALLALVIFRLDLSIYAFVGIIMLVGIVKKNAIMMIDFAIERERREHTTARNAILEAASVRFRPIITLYITPVVYTYLDAWQQRLARRRTARYTKPVAAEAGTAEVAG